MSPILEVKDLTRNFGGLAAVSNVNITLEEGELIGLIGPNGAGKTTVFNLLTGVYPPSSGEIDFSPDGEPASIAGKKPYDICRAGVGRTFQNIRLFKDLTVLDNVVIALEQNQTYSLLSSFLHLPSWAASREEVLKSARDLLRLMRLDHKSFDLARNLSYGEQRHLEIARALATNPRLLLLDEPAAGMNPTETEDLLHCINTIRDRFGIAILLIEHDMSLVMSVCQRIQVLDYGRTIASGTPEEIANNPQVISAYLGSDNNDDADGDSTTKAEPEPSIAKTLTEGAR